MTSPSERDNLLKALAVALSDLPKAVRVRTDSGGPNRLTYVAEEIRIDAPVVRLYDNREFLAACESIATHYGCSCGRDASGAITFRKT